MDITIHQTFLPQNDPDASLAFYRDTLGFEVRGDVGGGKRRWITVGPPSSPAPPSSYIRLRLAPTSPTTSAAPSPR
jgi:catechol 2,3-dioxygenase-like lactoylglutathione lyase family enzyme